MTHVAGPPPRGLAWRARRLAAWAVLALSVAACGDSPTQVGSGPDPGPVIPVAPGWTGTPLVLAVNENARMPQTPAGSMVFSFLNLSRQNNLGQLAITSGGGAPEFLTAPALSSQPEILVRNWNANNLSVTNVSLNDSTPIRVQAIGPGMPGTTPVALPLNTKLALPSGETAQGPTEPRFMQLLVQATSGDRSVVAVIGGPQDASGNNAYVIAVNADSTTGPPGTLPAPPGYFATTTGNSFVLNFNWAGGTIFVANLSASVSPPVSVVLRGL
ncbi:hypothetical protein [Longimicrobium sp.]|uniref:hypothetical protein n=1 Tax=Longimicrobium sp. TaxID=2029185 RepID=UPI003B3A1862